MVNRLSEFTRRGMLKLTGGTLGTLSATGLASAGASDELTVNVGYEDESSRQTILDVVSEVVYDFSFDAVTVTGLGSALRDLESDPGVRYVEENVEHEAFQLLPDGQALPYGIDRVDAEVAHTNDQTGDGADIAVIDTGIDNTHLDLQPNLGAGQAFLGGVELPVQQDDMGHGTFCAGVADAADNGLSVVGVSTGATLHAIQTFNPAGTALSMDIAAGINHAGEQGYDVANMSFGASQPAEVIRDACEFAYNEAGVLLVAAAGNSGPCEDCVGFPAAFDTVIAVSATDRNDDLAEFSSTGPEVELTAPGANILSTFPLNTTTRLSGTSFSCPHVAGAGGQLMANGLSNVEVRDQLASTAEDIGLAANEQGNGLLDVANALGLDSGDNLSDESSSGGGGSAPIGLL